MLTITQANIDKAREEQDGLLASQCCPVAQALKEAYPGKNISANYHALRVGDTFYRATLVIQDFMDDYDVKGRASPTKFRLFEVD